MQISFVLMVFATVLMALINASNMEEGGKTIQIVASSPVSKVTIKRGVDYEDVIIEKSPRKKKKKKKKAKSGKGSSRGRPRSYRDDDDDHQDELQQRVLYDRMLMDQLVEQLLLDAKRGRNKRKGRRRGGKRKNGSSGRRREEGREEDVQPEFDQESPIKELRHRRWTQVMEHLLEANWRTRI